MAIGESIGAASSVVQPRVDPADMTAILCGHIHTPRASSLAGLAYLLKERVADLEELVRAVREVVASRSVIDPRIVEVLVSGHTRIAESRHRHHPTVLVD